MPEPKPTPPIDLSVKYMAWDIKEISNSLKALVAAFKEFTETYALIKAESAIMPKKSEQKQMEMPF
jgi:hypothetical protein